MTSEQLQRRLSSNLKALRKQFSLSQEQLAEQAQISYQMMNDIEGCRRWPSEKTITKLANALKVDVSIFFLPEEKNNQLTPMQKQNAVNEFQKLFNQAINEYLTQ